MNINIDKLKSTIFNYPLLTDIDEDLILLAITEPNKYITNPLKNNLMLKYKDINNDRLEFLGDAVLELLISDLLYNKNIKSVGDMSKIRSVIVRNVSLICLMNDRNLCDISTVINKSCADLFEALIGAAYIHYNLYDNINPIKEMIGWMINIWNIDFIIDDIILNPNDENICDAIQRSYNDLLLVSPPYFDYIKDDYRKLEKIYEYYKLGKINIRETYIKKTNKWNAMIICPMALGCQYYVDKIKDTKYIANQYDYDRDKARKKAAIEATQIILNDYQLL